MKCFSNISMNLLLLLLLLLFAWCAKTFYEIELCEKFSNGSFAQLFDFGILSIQCARLVVCLCALWVWEIITKQLRTITNSLISMNYVQIYVNTYVPACSYVSSRPMHWLLGNEVGGEQRTVNYLAIDSKK